MKQVKKYPDIEVPSKSFPISDKFICTESVYRRRTDSTIAKRKSTKEQTTIYKTYIKTKDRVTQPPLKTGTLT
jgi:hypothetical protein